MTRPQMPHGHFMVPGERYEPWTSSPSPQYLLAGHAARTSLVSWDTEAQRPPQPPYAGP